jgi:aldehyde:ferredoxin oxidoreductase
MSRHILTVDLERGICSSRDLPAAVGREYLGGGGLAAYRYWQELAGGASPDDPLYIMTGPLTGTPIPFSPRAVIAARSPLTHRWGEANFGGWFGSELRRAGFDGIEFRGAANTPSYLRIRDGAAELVDAGHLWGRDTYEVADALSGQGRVLAIGPAGESGVAYAAVVTDKGHIAGRTGMGAVMGVKRLKAVVVKGSRRPPVADPRRVAALRRQLIDAARDNLLVQALSYFGTLASLDSGCLIGDIPLRNWSQGTWDAGFEKLTAAGYQEVLGEGRGTCYGCPIGCKRRIALDGIASAGPEYETVAAFGSLLLVHDLAAIARINDLCNRLGMDTISCGCTLAFATECQEAGLLTREQTGGIRLRWGDPAPLLEVLPLIARREGLGALLALGSASMADEVGEASRAFLTTVRRLEAPMHDPRALHGLGLAYATSTRGACHVESGTLWLEQSASSLPEFGLEGPFTMGTADGKARMVMLAQDIGQAMGSCAIVCVNGGMGMSVTELCQALTAVTGEGWEPAGLRQTGERVFVLKRCLNILLGDSECDDLLPPRLLLRLSDGPTRGSAPDIERMLAEWRDLRGFDAGGRPRRDRLMALGLADMDEAIGGREATG